MKGFSLTKIIAVIVVLAIVILAVVFGIKKIGSREDEISGNASINKDSYYAVFLNNNQIYFGHLSDVNDQYVDLTSVYYLQLTADTKDASTLNDSSKNDVALVKLGDEIHGPKDNMKINRDSISFYEELKADSKVMTAITKYKTEHNL